MPRTHHPGREPDPARTATPEAASALCDRLIQHTGELIALLDRETGLLQRGKPQEIAALQARKTALGAMLTRDMSEFRHDPAFIGSTVPDRVALLKEQHLQLQKSLVANQNALGAMKAVSESLLHAIAARASAQRSGPEVYGKDAGLTPAAPVGPAAISIDTTL